MEQNILRFIFQTGTLREHLIKHLDLLVSELCLNIKPFVVSSPVVYLSPKPPLFPMNKP